MEDASSIHPSESRERLGAVLLGCSGEAQQPVGLELEGRCREAEGG